MKGTVFVLCGLLLVTFVLPASAASFDCAKAGTAVEKMICADPELSELDDEMEEVYWQVGAYTADPVGGRAEQRNWLKSRNSCKDAVCVQQAYHARLSALRAFLAAPKPCFRLLERKWPEVQSGHYPVCVDVLKSMNKLCAELPLCEWKVDPSVTSLSLPQWEERLIGRKTNLLTGPSSEGEPRLVMAEERDRRNNSAANRFRSIVAVWKENYCSKPRGKQDSLGGK